MTPEIIPTALTPISIHVSTVKNNSTSLDGVDIRDYKGKLQVVLNASAAADNNQTATVKLQTSAEHNANFADFSPAIAFTAIAANGAAVLETVGVDTRVAKRYLRAHIGVTALGNGRAISIAATGVKKVTS